MVEKLFILGGNPRRRAKRSRRPAKRLFRHARRNPAVGAGDSIPAFLKSGMKPIRDKQARRRSKRGGLRAGSPEALAWGRKMKRARYKKAHPSARRTKKHVTRKTIRKGVRSMAKRRRKGGMRKGSPAAKAWGRKMKRIRAAKHSGRKTVRHHKKHARRHVRKTVVARKTRRHYRRHTMKVRKIMVPARYGKHYRKSGWKRVKVLSNPGGKLFSWLKFGGMVVGGFALATVANKLINKYIFKDDPAKALPPLYTGLGLSVLAILFGKKLWKQMPDSIVTGIVANTMISAVAQFAPKYLEWVAPAGAAAAISYTPATGTAEAYIPSALMDYGRSGYTGDPNPLVENAYAY